MYRHPTAIALTALVSACSPGVVPTDAGAADPCSPGGHVHREQEGGDWCHCDRGFRPAAEGLGCEVDPNFTGATTVDFTGTAERACWHATNGPHRTVGDDERADDFLTHFTLPLTSPHKGAPREGAVRYRAATTSVHVATVSADVTLELDEKLPSGSFRSVSILATEATAACPGLAHQFGFELVAKVEYRLRFGSSTQAQARFVIDQTR